MQEFMKQNERMDMTQEMMSDAVDMALGDEDEQQSDEIVQSVLSEIGIEVGEELGTGVRSGIGVEESKQPVDDLEARFRNL